uniref:Uncharacterized protein n=1 Tax=Canis lupus familiaris TaxID=9615 RepID=A0A8C0RXQ7_CANLF
MISLTMYGYSKKAAIYKPGSRSSGNTESAVTLILNVPTSRSVRNKCLLSKLPTLWCLS